MKQVLTILLSCFCISIVSSQDIHYSQFYHAPMNVSPALTGIFNGDQRFTASIRDQWRSVPVPWFTFSLAYDRKFYNSNRKDLFFAGGLGLNYDRQGDSELNLTNINLSGSLAKVINRKNVITLGATVGYATRGVNLDNVSWDSQWDGFAFDPNLGSGETAVNFKRRNILETALGLNYRWQKSKRTKIDLGISGFHLTQPDSRFDDVNSTVADLPIRMALYGIASFKLTDPLDLQLDVLYQDQGPYNELLFGGYLNIYLNRQRGKVTNLHVGLGYRTSGALYPKVAIEYNQFLFALSYDIDLSDFNVHTNYRGGPELHFRYILTNVQPLGQFKVCPIF